MAVVTLYLQSLLVLLLGLSHLVHGRSLLLPRDLQPVTKPNQALGFIDLNDLIAKSLLSQHSKSKARQPGHFQGQGYLEVRDVTIPTFTRGLKIGLRPAGWLNSYGEWTAQERDRAVFEAKDSSMLTRHLLRLRQQKFQPSLLTRSFPRAPRGIWNRCSQLPPG